MLSNALWMAREIGDTTTWERLRAVSESQFEPRYFGKDNSRFAYWLDRGESWPRGQLNATMMMIECAAPGAWSRVFTSPNTTMYTEPTVCDIDYPLIGVRRTHNDIQRRVLEIDTYAATPSRRGTPTTFTVDNLPDRAQVSLHIDGQACQSWRRTDTGAVAIDLGIDTHQIRLTYS
jgi:hypothetical protein